MARLLIFLFAISISTAALAAGTCPNIQGRYSHEDGPETYYMNITQNGCQGIVIVTEYVNKNSHIDDSEFEQAEMPSEISYKKADGITVGQNYSYTTDGFVYQYAEEDPNGQRIWWSDLKYVLDSSGNLKAYHYDPKHMTEDQAFVGLYVREISKR